MITNIQNTGYSDITQGQSTCHCARFKSTEALTGRRIMVDIGRYVSSPDDVGQMLRGYFKIYPSTPGAYAMTLQGVPSRLNNYKVTLTVISSTEFSVELCQIVGMDPNSYLVDRPYNSLDELTGSVAQGQKAIDIKVTAQFNERLEVANSMIPVNVKPFCDDFYYEIRKGKDGPLTNGWWDGEDMQAEFFFYSGIISSSFYAAIVRVDEYDNNENFIDDLNLNYASCTNITGQVEDLPFDKIIECRTIWQDESGIYSGKFLVDKSYFEPTGKYRFYIVYKDECNFSSCISGIIEQQQDETIPKINPFYETEVTFEIPSNTYTDSCYTNVLVCQYVEAYSSLPKASVLSELEAAGYPGLIWDNIFKGTEYCITDKLDINSICDGSIFVYFNYVDNGLTYKTGIEFDIPAKFAGGTFYIFNIFKFDIGGIDYRLYLPIGFYCTDYSEDITIKGDTLPDQICRDDLQTEQVFCFEGVETKSNFNARIECSGNQFGVNNDPIINADADFTTGEACLTIDWTSIEDDSECCLCLGASYDEDNPSGCDCGEFNYSWSVILQTPTNFLMAVQWDIFLTDIHNLKIYDRNSGKIYADTSDSSGSFYIGLTDDTSNLWLECSTKIGCFYTVQLQNIRIKIPDPPTKFSKTEWLCSDPVNNPPPPESKANPCSKAPAFDSYCSDLNNNDITNILNEDGGTIEVHEYSLDNGNTWNPYTSGNTITLGPTDERVYFHAVVDYDIPCYKVNLWDCIEKCVTCDIVLPVNPCDDIMSVTFSWVNEGLTVSRTIDPGCTPTEDIYKYSFDQLNWFDIVGVINTSGHNYVYLRSYVECDGCQSLYEETWERECKITCTQDGGGGTSPECLLTIDLEEIDCNLYLLHFNGNLGESSQTFDTHFIDYSASYNDRTVIEGRIRTEPTNDCNDLSFDSCYYSIKSYYRSCLSNALAFTTGGYIDHIIVSKHEASGGITPITIDLSAVIYSSPSSFVTAIRNAINTALTGMGYSQPNNYHLTVTIASGIINICFDYADVDQDTWVGIDRNNCEIQYTVDGTTPPVTLTEADNQGCPDNVTLDTSTDCQYNVGCGTLKFGANPIGGDGCGQADYVWIDDTQEFNFYNVPLIETAYTEKGTNVTHLDCTKYRLIGKAENFGTQVAWEWRNSAGTILSNLPIYDTYTNDTYTLKAVSVDGCVVEQQITIP